ncbi:OmpH family outer membrane protein [Neptunomonas antarctica]|uniref:Periplasmic chaperone for outer membrane proteins Skp n=1 Tax=Neptunomonas antarctica TaxID=619304 RepID=A0A1N7J9C3_9GAMM|nr:OmpH family outer membrane protein [Neptunomonas antarctica]SIS45861.1 periplasmic chaperone for outer membrane proteins Skp [Neptunomonas antarctica]
MKFLKVITICLSLSFVPVAFADKVAVLGYEEALLKTNAASTFRDTLKKELQGEEKRVLELEKQAKSLREKIQKNGATMDQDTLRQSQLQFQKAFEEYQRSGQALQQKGKERQQEFLNEMRPKLDAIVKNIIDENSYDVVISKKATVYVAKGFDITPEVIKLLNK